MKSCITNLSTKHSLQAFECSLRTNHVNKLSSSIKLFMGDAVSRTQLQTSSHLPAGRPIIVFIRRTICTSCPLTTCTFLMSIIYAKTDSYSSCILQKYKLISLLCLSQRLWLLNVKSDRIFVFESEKQTLAVIELIFIKTRPFGAVEKYS